MARAKNDRRLTYNIAASVDYRGPYDDVLTFCFHGAPIALVSEAFTFLCGHGHGICLSALVAEDEHMLLVASHDKGRDYLAVKLDEPNYGFVSLDGMKVLIEATLRRIHPCVVTWLGFDEYINT